MTNSPSPDSPPPQPQSSRRRDLGFDDFIGILVAFTTIGAILFWVLGRDDRFKGFPTVTGIVESSQPAPQKGVAIPSTGIVPTQPVPLATVTPTPGVPVVIAPSKESPSPIPVPSPGETVARVIPAIPVIVAPPPRSKTPPAAKSVKFVDVPDNFWAKPFIQSLQTRGFIGGFPRDYFKPNQPLTRAEFALMTQAIFDHNPVREAVEYKDVPSDFWAAAAIDKSTRTGFLKGYPGNTFQPKQQIPKVQAIVALANGLGLQPPADPGKTLQVYKDANQIPAYAKNAVAAATAAGLVVNHPDAAVLNPNKMVTRAEVAALIHQALVKEGKAEKINSKFIVKPK
ncbi:S-layer homology domain-containing protein [Microseira sp. BLCC-F43]|uniref:S-layer homology domain-containing protein n=1 Tax=Microseira sp. BLCC-F43 TaxID=3153602 RepID=UPI0035BA01C6